MPEINYVNVGVVQLDAGQDATIRVNVLIPFFTESTTYDQLAVGIAWRLTQQAVEPANYVVVDELREFNAVTRSKGPELKESVAVVQTTSDYLIAGIRAYALNPEELASHLSLLSDHMESSSLAAPDLAQSPHTLNVNIVLDGRYHRKRVVPTWTVADLIENCGADKFARIVDPDTGAALCPSDKCAHIVPLVARLEAERFEGEEGDADNGEPPVAMQTRDCDDEFTQPLGGGSSEAAAVAGRGASIFGFGADAYGGSVSMLALANDADLPD
jgi:hypothetical protein